MTATGLQPQSPASLLQQLIAAVAATNPGYTANLPGTLIEDVSSTSVGAIALCDSALVELVSSITPGTANEYLLQLLGAQFGIPQGVGYNTNVNVLFSGPAGFVISKGFLVSDGTYQYEVQDPVIIPTAGITGSVYCLATQLGSFAVPANTVTQIISAVPTGITLTVNNPIAGTTGSSGETIGAYQARVVQAGLAQCQGMPTFLRTLIQAVPGVQANLVSVLQKSGQWEVLVGGGDPYSVAFAIFLGMGDISNLVGSTLSVSNITQANPGVVTTNINHGFTTGQTIQMNGVVGMTAVNGVNYTATVTGLQTFSIGVNTSGFGAYVSGGIVTPNLRNVSVNINDYPNTYNVIYVTPPQQVVTVTASWNTTSTNFVNPSAVSSYAQPAMIAYINSITVGQPLNLLELQQVFQNSISSILPSQYLSVLTFAVSINGVPTSPTAGTSVIPGDPESYFFTSAANVSVVQI